MAADVPIRTSAATKRFGRVIGVLLEGHILAQLTANGRHRLNTIVEAEVNSMIKHDLVYAVRGLTKKPLFAVAAVVTLALGIGANAAIFSVVNAVLLRPLPYPSPERVMMLWTYNPRQGFDKDVSAYPNFDDWRRQSTSFAEMSAYTSAGFALTQAGEPAQIRGAVVTPGFFETLGVAPLLGRTFAPNENSAGVESSSITHD